MYIKNESAKAMAIAINEIEILKSPKQLSLKRFGVKASSLSNNVLLSRWIPDGFILSNALVAKIAKNELETKDIVKLKESLEELIKKSETLILRSSSSLEWVQGHSFAGLFSSFRGITNFDEFLTLIKKSYEEANSKKISDYAELKNVSLPQNHLALLVQNEIKCNKSALVVLDKESEHIEIFDGDIKNAVCGGITPSFSQVKNKTGVISEEGTIPLHFSVYDDLCAIIDSARQSMLNSNSVHLEIGFTNTQAFVFQVNNLPNQSVNNFLNNRHLDIFLTKSESMRWFYKVGLFKEKLKIYLFQTKEVLYKNILDDFDFEKTITLRLSYKNMVNLPRYFFRTKNELKQVLEQINIPKSERWEIIVHEYLNVRRSFELLLNKDYLLLEHIPGMWESDNILNPDVIYSDNKNVKTWVWGEERENLKFADSPENYNYYQKITIDDTLVDWQTKLNCVVCILREKFKSDLPLNFHFVEDDTQDWSFLNIRKGFDILQVKTVQIESHVISSISDVVNWDGVKPLHLKISSQRKNEEELLDIIQKLPRNIDDDVIIDFGLLSHPAILLREFGYNVVPSYFFSNINDSPSNYVFKTFDTGDDPIKRIMSESFVYDDDDFRVVYDKKPIVENHLLVLSKHSYTSMADEDDVVSKYNFLFKDLNGKKIIDNSFLVERGRAQFCTSGFTDSHAHAHLLPLTPFKENMIELFVEATKSQKMESLEDAINILRKSKNEYIMLVKEQEVYIRILSKGQSFEKQFIRNFLLKSKL